MADTFFTTLAAALAAQNTPEAIAAAQAAGAAELAANPTLQIFPDETARAQAAGAAELAALAPAAPEMVPSVPIAPATVLAGLFSELSAPSLASGPGPLSANTSDPAVPYRVQASGGQRKSLRGLRSDRFGGLENPSAFPSSYGRAARPAGSNRARAGGSSRGVASLKRTLSGKKKPLY